MFKISQDIKKLEGMEGNGLEIGAFGTPFEYNTQKCKMIYADKYGKDELKNIAQKFAYKYDETKVPDNAYYIKDISNMTVIPSNSMDFVCSSHVLEHSVDFLGGIAECLRVVKKGGLVYSIIPDKRYTFDVNRPLTNFDHLADDYAKPPTEIEYEVYEEIYSPDLISAKTCYEEQTPVHVHTFSYGTFPTMMTILADRFGYKLIEYKLHGINICFLLEKI